MKIKNKEDLEIVSAVTHDNWIEPAVSWVISEHQFVFCKGKWMPTLKENMNESIDDYELFSAHYIEEGEKLPHETSNKYQYISLKQLKEWK